MTVSKIIFLKMTRYITNYCVKNDIHTVVIGDIKGDS